MTGRNIDDQISDAAVAYRLQVFTDGLKVDAVDQRGIRFQHMPGLHHEFMQIPTGFFGLQQLPVGNRPPGWHRAARVARL